MTKWKNLQSKITVLGVDPGLRVTGYGVVEAQSGPGHRIRLLEAGTIKPDTKTEIAQRLEKIHKNLTDIVREYSPNVMVLEKLYAHWRHPNTASILGHARGVISMICAQEGLELCEYSVKRIRKALLGNGNATKEQTRAGICHALSINPAKLEMDASDALALALGYVHMKRI